jgi:thiamine pyrophosphokinase
VIVVGGAGGRHDHELATALLLTSPRWAGLEEIDWISGRSRSHVIRGRRLVHGDIGITLSLIPGVEGAYGVETKGLRWNMAGEDLKAGTTRGVSNVMTAPIADIRLGLGCLLAVIPADQP